MLAARPRRLVMRRGIVDAEPDALRRTLAALVGAGRLRGARLQRCLASALGTEPGSLTVLLAPDEDEAVAQLPPGRSTIALERCRPPSRTGFTTYSIDDTGGAPVTAMVAVCSVYPGPEKQTAFHRWYNHHIVEVLGRGLFHTAHRYLAVEPEADGSRRHWALYEADVKEPASLPGDIVTAGEGDGRGSSGAIIGETPPGGGGGATVCAPPSGLSTRQSRGRCDESA